MPPDAEHRPHYSSVGENEAFQRLMQVGLGDPEARKELISVLALEESQRKPALHTFAQRLQLRNEPALAAAIASLCDDEVAARTVSMLEQEAGDELDQTQSVLGQFLLVPKILIGMAVGSGIPLIVATTVAPYLWMQFIEPGDMGMAIASACAVIGLVIGGLVAARLRWSTVLLVVLLAITIGLGCYHLTPDRVVRVVVFEGVVIPLYGPRFPNILGPLGYDGKGSDLRKYRVNKVFVGKMKEREVRILHPPGQSICELPGVGTKVIVVAEEVPYASYTALRVATCGTHRPRREDQTGDPAPPGSNR